MLCLVAYAHFSSPVVSAGSATTARFSGSGPAACAQPSPAPGQIAATRVSGRLRVTLAIASPVLGATRLFVWIRPGGAANVASVRVKLGMPAYDTIPVSTVVLAPAPGGYAGSGDILALGHWHADIVLRSASSARVTIVPFDFLAGPGAGFLSLAPVPARYGPATIEFVQRADSTSTLRILLRPGLQVHFVMAMPSMPDMGTADLAMVGASGGWYAGHPYFAMSGVATVSVVVRDGSGWFLARRLIFDVNPSNRAKLLLVSLVRA